MRFIRVLIYTIFASSVWSLSSPTPDRKQWDLRRFVQQSSKFVSFTPTLEFFRSKQNEVEVLPGEILWKPSDVGKFTMSPLDDVVMGGVSGSEFDDDTGTWAGFVTDASNGGFIGIRSAPPSLVWNMKDCAGFQWKVRAPAGTPRRCKFVVRDSTDFNGVSWTTIAQVPPGKVSFVRVMFDDLKPTRFARTLSSQQLNDGELQKSTIRAFQITYSKFDFDGALNPTFEVGDFRLQLLELQAI